MTANDVYRGNKVNSDMKRVQKLYSRRRRRRREEKRARTRKIRIGGKDMLLPPWPEHSRRVTAGKAKNQAAAGQKMIVVLYKETHRSRME